MEKVTELASSPTPRTAAPLLRLQGITKSFFSVQVLHGISFDVRPGEVLGLCGENGSGKSTTMNILGGVLRRDSGEMFLAEARYEPRHPRDAEAAGIGFIQQELNIFANLSVEENLFLGRFPRVAGSLPIIDRRRMRRDAARLLEQVNLRLSPQSPASILSPGERQLVEIAKVLSLQARIMIFDEPTTSLTSRETVRLFEVIQQLRQSGIGIIYISHVLSDVMNLASYILVLRDGRVSLSAPRAEVTTQSLITAMVGRSIEALFPVCEPKALGRPLLKAEGITQPGIVRDISLSVAEGEIVGIAGLMGSGRSELARILFGLDPFESGRITLGGRPLLSQVLSTRIAGGVAFLTEDRRHEGLMMEGTVGENLAIAALPLLTNSFGQVDDARLNKEMGKMRSQLQIKTQDLTTTPVRSLSGGNQQKVVLGKWLLRRPRLLILDEPTRGVDIGAKQEIYRLISNLSKDGLGVLVISSEMEELIGLCDRILVMNRGEIGGSFQRGGFEREMILAAAMWKGVAV
jgi:ribose transport system ATP-binding protein